MNNQNIDNSAITADPRLFIESLGYDICEDSKQTGHWIWISGSGEGNSSFSTVKEALDSAWNDAVAQTLVCRAISTDDWGRMDFDSQRIAISLALSGALPRLDELSSDTQMKWVSKVKKDHPSINDKKASRYAQQSFFVNNGVLTKEQSSVPHRFNRAGVPAGSSKEIYALHALLAGLEDLGFGTDDEINGADAVQAISELYVDVTQRILGGASLEKLKI